MEKKYKSTEGEKNNRVKKRLPLLQSIGQNWSAKVRRPVGKESLNGIRYAISRDKRKMGTESWKKLVYTREEEKERKMKGKKEQDRGRKNREEEAIPEAMGGRNEQPKKQIFRSN